MFGQAVRSFVWSALEGPTPSSVRHPNGPDENHRRTTEGRLEIYPFCFLEKFRFDP